MDLTIPAAFAHGKDQISVDFFGIHVLKDNDSAETKQGVP